MLQLHKLLVLHSQACDLKFAHCSTVLDLCVERMTDQKDSTDRLKGRQKHCDILMLNGHQGDTMNQMTWKVAYTPSFNTMRFYANEAVVS